jgi:hypothetical protein
VRNATLQAALAVLVKDGRVLKDRAGYAIAARAAELRLTP